MTPVCAKSQSRMRWTALVGLVTGVALFQFFGNATRGYVDTPSLFWWWISQWIDPQAETEHGWLILGLSGWVFWRNLRRAERAERRVESSEDRAESGERRAESDEPGLGTRRPRRVQDGESSADDTEVVPPFRTLWMPFAVVVGALLLHALGFVAQQSRVSIIALLMFSWATVAFVDRRWARAAAFPLGFMVFAIPLNVLDSVGFWLRMGVIDASSAIAHFAGLDVVRSGTQLFAPDGRFQYDVAAACSGVRSLMALSALSLLIGYLWFQTAWRRALMLALCFPLTYLGNVARVTMIIFAAEMGGPKWGALMHDLMGYGIFVIVLGGVLGAAAFLRRVWPERKVANHALGNGGSTSVWTKLDADDTEVVPPQKRTKFVTGWAVLVVVGVAVEMIFLARISNSQERGAAGVQLAENGDDPIELPAFIGTEWIGRRAEVSQVERDILPPDTGFSRRTYVSVADRSHAVFLSIVLSGRDRTSIHRPEICLVGQGWTIDSAGEHAFGRKDRNDRTVPATLLRATLIEPGSQREIRTLIAFCFVNADVIVANHWQRFWRDAWNRVWSGRVDRWAYVLLQADAQDGEVAALERMQTVLDKIGPVFLRPELQ